MRKNTDHVNYTDLGKRIRKKREAAGLKQEQVAEYIDSDSSHISKIESGTTKISLPMPLLIANLLNVSADELLCGSLKVSSHVYQGAIMEQLQDCSVQELRTIEEMIRCLLTQLRTNYPQKQEEK